MLFLRGLLQRVVANKHLINCQIDLYPNVFIIDLLSYQ